MLVVGQESGVRKRGVTRRQTSGACGAQRGWKAGSFQGSLGFSQHLSSLPFLTLPGPVTTPLFPFSALSGDGRWVLSTGIKNRFSRKCGVYVETALQYSVSLLREAEAGGGLQSKSKEDSEEYFETGILCHMADNGAVLVQVWADGSWAMSRGCCVSPRSRWPLCGCRHQAAMPRSPPSSTPGFPGCSSGQGYTSDSMLVPAPAHRRAG